MVFLGIFIFLYCSVAGCISQASNYHVAEVDKVTLDVYMETQCPDTLEFLENQLEPITKSLGNYINLNMYPYGKASEQYVNSKWTFSCQHGHRECRGNLILGCVISMTNQSVYVPYSVCLMQDLDPVSNFEKCCLAFGLKSESLTECIKGTKGNEIQHKNAVQTDSLVPKLTFIPWIIVNKEYSKENQEDALANLKDLICRNLKIKPEACS